MVKKAPLVVVGIDLTGSPKQPTGLCVLRDLSAETRVALTMTIFSISLRRRALLSYRLMRRLVCRTDG